MNPLQGLFLGIVQGLTEFLPISSSGHLTLVPFVFGWDIPSAAFDVSVHLGTLIGIVWVLRERVLDLLRALIGWARAAEDTKRTWRLLVIGTVPVAVFGLAAKARIEDLFERPVAISFLLGVTGWVLLSVEHRVRVHEAAVRAGEIIATERDDRDLETPDAAIIGVAQAVAILPGISRSGATISAGMIRGMSRVAAARFSFLLAIPAILGATIVKIPDIGGEAGAGGAGAIVLGTIAAAVTGAWTVKWFLRLVERRGMRPFGIYCFFAMSAGLLTALARG